MVRYRLELPVLHIIQGRRGLGTQGDYSHSNEEPPCYALFRERFLMTTPQQ